MNGTVPSSFPPESPAPRRISRRLLLVAAAVVLVLALAGALLRWHQVQSDRAALAERMAAVRQAAISAILADWELHSVCPSDDGTDQPCQSWLVDASVTRNGTITIVSVTGSPEEQVPNDGVATEEALTGTLNISRMVILPEELP